MRVCSVELTKKGVVLERSDVDILDCCLKTGFTTYKKTSKPLRAVGGRGCKKRILIFGEWFYLADLIALKAGIIGFMVSTAPSVLFIDGNNENCCYLNLMGDRFAHNLRAKKAINKLIQRYQGTVLAFGLIQSRHTLGMSFMDFYTYLGIPSLELISISSIDHIVPRCVSASYNESLKLSKWFNLTLIPMYENSLKGDIILDCYSSLFILGIKYKSLIGVRWSQKDRELKEFSLYKDNGYFYIVTRNGEHVISTKDGNKVNLVFQFLIERFSPTELNKNMIFVLRRLRVKEHQGTTCFSNTISNKCYSSIEKYFYDSLSMKGFWDVTF